MQVDRVRHDGCPDDADRQGDAAGAGQFRHHRVEGEGTPVGRGDEQLHQIGQADDPDEGADGDFQRPEASGLEAEQAPGDGEGEQEGREHGHAGQQTETDGRADQFGQIGGHGGDFARDPHRGDERAGEMDAAERGEAVAGDDADAGGQRLKQHGDRVGQDHDPQQQIPVLCAGLDVGREIAGVHVGDGGDDGRPGERQDRAQTAAATGHDLPAGLRGPFGEVGSLDDRLAHGLDCGLW